MSLVVKYLPADAGDVRDVGSIPGWGRSPGGWRDNPLQHSCLENPIGQRSLAGYRPRSRKESDTTEAMWHACHYCSVIHAALSSLNATADSAHSACSCVSSIRGLCYSAEKSHKIPNSRSASAIRDRTNSRLWCNFMSLMYLDGFYKWFRNWVTQMSKILTGALPYDQLCEWTWAGGFNRKTVATQPELKQNKRLPSWHASCGHSLSDAQILSAAPSPRPEILSQPLHRLTHTRVPTVPNSLLASDASTRYVNLEREVISH